nr:ABC transporter permease [Gordonibacter pamelaeae]
MAAISAAVMAYITDPTFVQSMQAASASGAPTGVHIGFSNGSGPSADDLAETNALAAQLSQGMTPEALVGSVFLGGGGLSCLFVVFLAIFLAAEFESGFSKNVFTVQPSRLAFLGARIVVTLVLAVLFTAVIVAATLATAAVTGLELVSTPLPDFALWGVLVALVAAGFGMLTALAVWVTRKMAAGIGIGILLASGLVTLGIQGLGMLVPSISFLSDYTLSSCMGSLSLGLGGPLGAVHIALVGAAFIAVAAVLSAAVLKRKDV